MFFVSRVSNIYYSPHGYDTPHNTIKISGGELYVHAAEKCIQCKA